MYRIATLFCSFLFFGCAPFPKGNYFKDGVAQYKGEGSIRDVSQRGGFFSTRGYVIEMDKFDLGSAYRKQIPLVSLPVIEERAISVRLAIQSEELTRLYVDSLNDFKKSLDAEVTIAVVNSAGINVLNFSEKLGSCTWSSPVHGYTGYWLYPYPKKSYFKPQPGEDYTLHIKYSPDEALRGKQGRIYLRCIAGGS